MAPPLNPLALTPTITPVTGTIGAVIGDVDLTRPLDAGTVAIVRDALHQHSVIFFHDQDLDEEQQIAFASQFGTVSPYALTKMLGGTRLVSTIEDTADSPPDADGWHTDVSWVAEPPAYAVLNAKVIPERGGDTMWSSLFAAYDALSPVMQRLCDQLTVRHHAGDDFRERVARTVNDETADRIAREFPPVEHPLVRTHPVTGRRALWVSGRFMDQIVGMHRTESDALLGYLNHHIEDPNFCVRWRWQPNDLAIWDEASTNHRALSDHYPAHRAMRRCTVDGSRPYFTADERGQH
jgi:taurine dioxygenase